MAFIMAIIKGKKTILELAAFRGPGQRQSITTPLYYMHQYVELLSAGDKYVK